jgi:hypothetical protein
MIKSLKDEPGNKYWETKYHKNAVVPLSEHQTLRMQFGFSHKNPYMRFDFNPASCGTDEWNVLHAELGYLFEFGYDALLTQAKVTYLEIAVDCTDILCKGLMSFDTKLRNSAWYPSFGNPSPTCYLGRRGSQRVIRVYDRVAKLLAYGKTAPDHPVTRIEAVLRRLNCTVAELKDVVNPFSSFGPCLVSDLEQAWTDPEWQQFLAHSKIKGTSEALQLAGKAKKSFKKRLVDRVCKWWSNETVWALYPSSLQTLAQ